MRPILIAFGWLVFSSAYFFGVMGLALAFFPAQGSFWTLVTLIAALLLWGYFTAYLIAASRLRDAKPESNAS